MSRLADMPNVCVKISGLGQRGLPWTVESNRYIIEETIAMFGAERAMFGSNFPVDKLCASFDEIYGGFKRIATRYSREDQSRLFCETARDYYQIAMPTVSFEHLALAN
jgi:predicted TIM-barrel fold metal-dependent hydrolase